MDCNEGWPLSSHCLFMNKNMSVTECVVNSPCFVPSQILPVGAVGAVVYSGLTGGQLQQFIPLFLPLLLRVHQTRLREKGHTHTHTSVHTQTNICHLERECQMSQKHAAMLLYHTTRLRAHS